MVEKYLTLRQTFFPAGSSVLEKDQEQLSRALRAPRRRFISTEGHTEKKPTNPGTESSSFCLFSQVFSSRSSYSCINQRRRSERQDLPFCLASIPSASLPGGVLQLQRSRRGRNPRVSFSHFLGKPESLPSIQPDAKLFKDG